MSIAPAIDPDEIIIEQREIEPPDCMFDITLPAHCVQQIKDRLSEGEENWEGDKLSNLLTQICIEEAIGRFELEPLWGTGIVTKGASPQPTPDDDFCFTALIDQLPAVDWSDWSSFKIDRPVLEIDEAMVEHELEEQRLGISPRTSSTAPLTRGDEAIGVMAIDPAQGGSPLLDSFETIICVPAEGRDAVVDGLPIKGLAEAMRGASIGDVVEVTAEVPRAMAKTAQVGQRMRCRFEITAANRPIMASTEDVVARLGSPSETVLRQQIKQSLIYSFEWKQMEHLVEVVMVDLVARIDPPVPQRIKEKNLRERQMAIVTLLKERGESDSDIKQHLAGGHVELQAEVTAALQRHVVTSLLRRTFNLEVSEPEIEAQIQMMASLQGKRPETLRREIVDADSIDKVAKSVFERKATEKILLEATVRDVPAASLGATSE